MGRMLHPNPDRVIDARLTACPNCEAAFPFDASQTPQQIYERIELPPVKPDVTQVRLFGGRCRGVAARELPPKPRPGWSKVHPSASRSRPWWCICITPMPSAWSGWSR